MDGGGVDFSGDAWRGPKDGMGLVLVFGAMVGKGLVDVVANFDIVWSIGYGILELLESRRLDVHEEPGPSDVAENQS
jgi:hypothetical protein